MGWGEANVCFCKMFYKFLKEKCFQTFYKEFYNQRKIFYKFDHILHANKHQLKVGKHYPNNI